MADDKIPADLQELIKLEIARQVKLQVKQQLKDVLRQSVERGSLGGRKY